MSDKNKDLSEANHKVCRIFSHKFLDTGVFYETRQGVKRQKRLREPINKLVNAAKIVRDLNNNGVVYIQAFRGSNIGAALRAVNSVMQNNLQLDLGEPQLILNPADDEYRSSWELNLTIKNSSGASVLMPEV